MHGMEANQGICVIQKGALLTAKVWFLLFPGLRPGLLHRAQPRVPGGLDRLRGLTGHDGTAVGTPSQRMSINGAALSPRPRYTVRSGELDLGMSVRSGQDRRPSHSGMGISIGQTTLSGIDMSLTNSDGSTTAIVCAAESQTRSNSLVLHSVRSLFAAQVLQ
jgi:hypothetical protein